jgi:glycosyltransferase involved in cell wall biosynthesis
VRIVLFTDTYPNDVNGVARTLGMLVAHAVARGHEVALVTPRVSPEAAANATGHRQLSGVPVPMYPELQLARGVDGEGRRMLEAFRPDLVHVATESTVGFSGRRWALRSGVPLVSSFHTNFPAYLHDYRMGPLEPLLWRYLRWFHDRSLVTFCPSWDTLESLLARDFHTRMRVWSRGVDTELFSPARRNAAVRERIAPGADRILVYVGRLAAEKRVDFLLDAFIRLRDATGPGTALVYVGDGPAAEKLRARAVEGVHFTGFLRGEALAEAYAAADLFVFASDTETFGNVVLEALASGVPAVVVDKGGVRETVVPGRTGVRVPVGDVAAFAEACVALLRDDALRAALARGAREEALSRRWKAILDGLLREYDAAVASARGDLARAALTGAAIAGESDAVRAHVRGASAPAAARGG